MKFNPVSQKKKWRVIKKEKKTHTSRHAPFPPSPSGPTHALTRTQRFRSTPPRPQWLSPPPTTSSASPPPPPACRGGGSSAPGSPALLRSRPRGGERLWSPGESGSLRACLWEGWDRVVPARSRIESTGFVLVPACAARDGTGSVAGRSCSSLLFVRSFVTEESSCRAHMV